MRLVFPSIEYKEKAIEFVKEFDKDKLELAGTGGLERFLSESGYEAWIEKVRADIDIANVEPSRVPALTYFYVRSEDDKIVGMVNIRLALNEFLKKEGGHIGYCIRPSERKKYYATKMLGEVLRVCAKIDLKEVIITCDKDNEASSRTIRKYNSRLVKEFYSDTFKSDIQKYIVLTEFEEEDGIVVRRPTDYALISQKIAIYARNEYHRNESCYDVYDTVKCSLKKHNVDFSELQLRIAENVDYVKLIWQIVLDLRFACDTDCKYGEVSDYRNDKEWLSDIVDIILAETDEFGWYIDTTPIDCKKYTELCKEYGLE